MDEIAQYHIRRWKALAKANALFTRPVLHLTPASARALLDAEGRPGELAGKRVLCLASGGGKQSAMFALLGCQVTVLDISADQLERDHQAATHYQYSIEMVEGDMRDLSRFSQSAIFLHRWSRDQL